MSKRRMWVAAAVIVAAIAALCSCMRAPAGSAGQPPTASQPGVQLLAQLRIAPEDPKAPYSAAIRKAEWGDGWDSRGHGCNTRDLILSTQSQGELRVGTGCRQDCVAEWACWTSPYDGRPTRDPGELQIDHIVPVGEAARSPVVGSGPAGDAAVAAATVWSRAQKHLFYEDPNNLVAVTSAVNEGKGDGDPAEWKPADHSYWCKYATTYTQNKIRWDLSVDQAEFDALKTMFETCPTTRGK